ncbi:terminase large subunit [Escherichia phage vB_EcoM_APEC]|nr:terminase large subunit [Escherichia phage vB_EcoM_APEC]
MTNLSEIDIVVLKRNETMKMKEYLNEKYELINAPESEAKEPHAKGWIEVPEGAEILTVGIDQRVFWKGDLSWNIDGYETKEWRSTDSFPIYMKNYEKTVKVLWQRNAPTLTEELPFIDDEPHGHYKKDVSNLNSIDVYRVLKLFDVKDPALQHAVKKILCAGDRGTKDKVQDIQEAIASLNRSLEMIKEDGCM